MRNFKPKQALLSLSNKEGILPLAKTLMKENINIIATANTADYLKENGVMVTEISEYTQFPEILDGRVKTLHPSIFAGILARGHQDNALLDELQIKSFDLLIIDLYPFKKVIQNQDISFDIAIENIDIGGTALIRAAAKNHAFITVIVDKNDYSQLQQYIEDQQIPENWAFTLAGKAFAYTADYEVAIANYFQQKNTNPLSPNITNYENPIELRYGENPHQRAFLYQEKNKTHSFAFAKQIQGKELSYNNILDAEAAFQTIKLFKNKKPSCVIVKHGNPCGIASNSTQKEAYLQAFATDPISSFGGILAFNTEIEEETAKIIIDKQFCEVIVAPSISILGKEILANRKNIRVLITGEFLNEQVVQWQSKSIDGGILVQEKDNLNFDLSHFKIVTQLNQIDFLKDDLNFSWLVIKEIKSNAMVLVKNEATIGIGAGQTSRILSTEIALKQASQFGHFIQGAVLASDAFIPFADSLEIAAKAGVKAVIQPGGSIHDNLIIEKANELGLIMIFTGTRHFKH